MGIMDQYCVVREYLFVLQRPNNSEVCSENSDCHMWTDRFLFVSVDHSNNVPRNQSESPFQSTWSIEDISALNCYYTSFC